MMRTLAVAVAITAGLLLAAGCSPASPSTGGPVPLAGALQTGTETGPVTFATGKDDAGFYRTLVAGWNHAHPARKITLLLLPESANGQLAQLAANLQAKSPLYDVINMDVIWTAEFASAGWILPLDASSFPLRDFLAPAVRTAQYAGRLYAVPFYSNAELLYYRSDVLRRAGVRPPRTWAELARLARTIAPLYHLGGYGSQFAPYEGLTVNFASAVQSAGGSLLHVNSPAGLAALKFLVNGFRAGWIPKASLTYEEESSRQAFESGKLLFLANWPYVYGDIATPVRYNKVFGQVGVTALPGPSGAGSGSLGGANLAVSAFSRHQSTALAFIRYATGLASERAMLTGASFPPVWTRLYSDPALIHRFPYLPVLKQAIQDSQPRPAITDYDQASLVISSAVYQALTFQKTPQQALRDMAAALEQIIR
jgi:multiple sugar transport system substrate-binding protein